MSFYREPAIQSLQSDLVCTISATSVSAFNAALVYASQLPEVRRGCCVVFDWRLDGLQAALALELLATQLPISDSKGLVYCRSVEAAGRPELSYG